MGHVKVVTKIAAPAEVCFDVARSVDAHVESASFSFEKLVAQNAQAILKLERPYNPGLTIHDIPVDAVTTS